MLLSTVGSLLFNSGCNSCKVGLAMVLLLLARWLLSRLTAALVQWTAANQLCIHHAYCCPSLSAAAVHLQRVPICTAASSAVAACSVPSWHRAVAAMVGSCAWEPAAFCAAAELRIDCWAIIYLMLLEFYGCSRLTVRRQPPSSRAPCISVAVPTATAAVS
jgi:hypothetical protein